MILHSYVPTDLRTVDPRQVKAWDPGKAARVTAVRLQIRFGPDSDNPDPMIAQMLGLAESPVLTRYNPTSHQHDLVFVCTVCGKERTRSMKSRALADGVCGPCRALRNRAAS